MPQRHSKNNNDLAFFTYDEKKKLGYGTQKERLGKDSIKPFDACCLCLKPFIDAMSCSKGHVFCKECILECLLAQKKDIQRWSVKLFTTGFFVIRQKIKKILNLCIYDKDAFMCQCCDKKCVFLPVRKLAAHELQKKQEKEEDEEKLNLQKARELDAFDQQNHGAVPQYSDRNHSQDKPGFHGANSVKMPLPQVLSAQKATKKLKLKSLFPVYFTEDTSEKKSSSSLDKTYICPSCKVTLTNTLSLVALSSCGHVFCKKCSDKFMAVDKVCLVCSKGCKERNLVDLGKGGTGFAGHGDHLMATEFKHLGSGSGLGLVRPAAKS
ncbi:ENOS INTERACTING PROTEIN [Salix viminalis]|uniref:ENOS INTERACTING PROTEIN n=1 Tax=Salix viminalis TaxID=40686 RepID=A0A9Q0QIG9_SALVM|nr:ENOS INTERACTING PROTEIN [Salix viminalis]